MSFRVVAKKFAAFLQRNLSECSIILLKTGYFSRRKNRDVLFDVYLLLCLVYAYLNKKFDLMLTERAKAYSSS